MTHYIAIVHKDPDSAWGVSFPDLPGCFSAADEEADLLPNAMEALELFAEDAGELPRPRVNITLDKGLLEAIDAEAVRRKMTRSGLLAQAVAKEITG